MLLYEPQHLFDISVQRHEEQFVFSAGGFSSQQYALRKLGVNSQAGWPKEMAGALASLTDVVVDEIAPAFLTPSGGLIPNHAPFLARQVAEFINIERLRLHLPPAFVATTGRINRSDMPPPTHGIPYSARTADQRLETKQRNTRFIAPGRVANRRVVFVDDLFVTGLSAHTVLQLAKDGGATSAHILTIGKIAPENAIAENHLNKSGVTDLSYVADAGERHGIRLTRRLADFLKHGGADDPIGAHRILSMLTVHEVRMFTRSFKSAQHLGEFRAAIAESGDSSNLLGSTHAPNLGR